MQNVARLAPSVRSILAVLALVSSLAAVAPASAQSGTSAPSLAVSPDLVTPAPSAVGASGTVASGLMTVASGIALHLGPDGAGASDARWRGGILFDEGFRSAVRLAAVDDQEIARTISDITLGAAILNAAAVDAVAIPLAQGDTDLAWRASLAHALAQGLTLSIGEVVKRGSERARPFERECANDPQRAGCGDSDRFHSFFSLHTGMAFTSAGFSCAMHSARPLYQDVAADASSCLASIALASTTGLLRVASDRHYLSDVLVGAALGFAIGYLVPLAIVPERRAEPGEGPVQNWAVAPMLAPGTDGSSMASGTFGLSVFGAF